VTDGTGQANSKSAAYFNVTGSSLIIMVREAPGKEHAARAYELEHRPGAHPRATLWPSPGDLPILTHHENRA
jgi:hypothetical protein